MAYRLAMPDFIVYGRNAFQEVGSEASRYGRRVLIVSDPVMVRLGITAQCEQHLQQQGCTVHIYSGVDREPTDVHVSEALELGREIKCAVVIGLGGGSAIDTAKAVSVLLTNVGTLSDYMGNRKLFANLPIPLIAIPTTAGTGSEVTQVTVIIDTKTDIKMMMSQPALMPSVAIIDPVLTMTCPAHVAAASGLDALCHAVEAFISRRAHPLTDSYALQAVKLIMEHLPAVYKQTTDVHAHEQMALAAMMAGTAFSNASVTLIHGMSRPIGALFHVPHGISNAMLLPAVLEYTKHNARERLASLERHINPGYSGSDQELSDSFIIRIKQICKQLNIPNLQKWGIDSQAFERQLGKMTQDAIASGSPANNPRVPDTEEMIRLYHQCYDYEI